MATVRTAGSSILSTITDTAKSFSTIMNTANDGITMLHNSVKHNLHKQEESQMIDLVDYRNRLIDDTSKQIAERREAINEWLKNNETRQEYYNEARNSLKSAFEAFDKRTKTESN